METGWEYRTLFLCKLVEPSQNSPSLGDTAQLQIRCRDSPRLYSNTLLTFTNIFRF